MTLTRPDKMLAGALSRATALRSQTQAQQLRRRPRLSRGPTQCLDATDAHPCPRPISHTAPRTRLEACPHQAHHNRKPLSPGEPPNTAVPTPYASHFLANAPLPVVRWPPPATPAGPSVDRRTGSSPCAPGILCHPQPYCAKLRDAGSDGKRHVQIRCVFLSIRCGMSPATPGHSSVSKDDESRVGSAQNRRPNWA